MLFRSLADVFEMAMHLERNGREFYSAAADRAEEGRVKELLSELVEWERRHEELFGDMRDIAVSSGAAIAEGSEAAAYVHAVVDGRIFKHRDEALARLTGESTEEEILDMAIELETSAVLFFLGIRELAGQGKEKIDAIIAEEMRHVCMLSEQMAS